MGYTAIVDYGVGNLKSVSNAMAYIGQKTLITGDAAGLERADAVILPGVGAFPDAADKLRQATGLGSALEKAESTCLGSWYRVAVGSVQSLMREKRLSRFDPGYFQTIVVDEAHHVLSEGYRRVLDPFSPARVLGVTATPDRGDMRSLGQFF